MCHWLISVTNLWLHKEKSINLLSIQHSLLCVCVCVCVCVSTTCIQTTHQWTSSIDYRCSTQYKSVDPQPIVKMWKQMCLFSIYNSQSGTAPLWIYTAVYTQQNFINESASAVCWEGYLIFDDETAFSRGTLIKHLKVSHSLFLFSCLSSAKAFSWINILLSNKHIPNIVLLPYSKCTLNINSL